MLNERMQQTKLLKISETKIKETEKQIQTKDKLSEILRAENEMIKLEEEFPRQNSPRRKPQP